MLPSKQIFSAFRINMYLSRQNGVRLQTGIFHLVDLRCLIKLTRSLKLRPASVYYMKSVLMDFLTVDAKSDTV